MATEEPVVAVESVPEPATADQPAVKETKKKKAAKPRNPPLHPPYVEMVAEAIVALKDKNGSSQYAITKFIEEKQKQLPPNFKKLLLFQLKKLVASGKIVKVKASFKLPSTPPSSALAKKKPVPAKKQPVVKPKSVAAIKAKKVPVKAKAAALKPKTVGKPKPAPKAKPTTKPKAAAMPKAVAKPKPKAVEKPTKAARTSTRTSPGKRAPASKPAPKKAPAKKVPAKSAKSKTVKSPAKKAATKTAKK